MTRLNPRLLTAFTKFIIVFLLSFLIIGCSDELGVKDEDASMKVSGSLVGTTECKYSAALDLDSPVNLDCVNWSFDGSDKLTIVHVNATLNCCPGTIAGLVDINGGDITIEEKEGEDSEPCDCLCLYDLTYEVTGIGGGEVTITFVEHYIPEGAAILSVAIDLDAEPEGSFCISRNVYPWGALTFEEEPAGSIEEYAGCETVTGTLDSVEEEVLSCVTVHTFPASGTMRIYHTNTQLNCCVYGVTAEYDISDGLITITTSEAPPGGLCYCICPYDVFHILVNLEPGIYTIRFVEKYLKQGEEELEIAVDLSQPGVWTECVARDF